MQDGIIAGNGNSRYLKTVSAALGLYPTYEDFMAALIAGTFPIDLNGINAAGWTQQGTALNKANLLTDATCSALGIATTATPNNAFEKIKQMIDTANISINSKTFIVNGSYIGELSSGQDVAKNITLGFSPKLFIFGKADYYGNNSVIFSSLVKQGYVSNGQERITADILSTGITIHGKRYYVNENGEQYYYTALS